MSDTKNIVQDSSLVLDNEGNLLFYYYDAFEDSQIYPGQVFLFGKVKIIFINKFFNKIK